MKKFSALAAAVLALAATSVQAQDFILLSTPEDVFNNSTEDVDGAKAEFQTVLADINSTDEQKTAAMQSYMQQASPKPGYGFDMSFLLSLNAVNEENKGKYTQGALAEAWHTDVPDVVFGANKVLTFGTATTKEMYLRVNAPAQFKLESSYNKFAAYQTVTLSEGAYQLSSFAFVNGLAKAANLAAGDNLGTDIVGLGSGMTSYTVNFKMAATEEIKLGYVRNATAGNLNYIAFNNMYLYKVSDLIEITDNATEGLAAATDVNIQLSRNFTAGQYTPICLPFIIENWREIFDDLIIWNNYNEDGLSFGTISGANTQARKPYLAKPKADINAENYLVFRGVDVQKGNAGTWIKSVAEGEDAFPVFMAGNWAAGTVPAGCYYLDGETWKLSNGTATLPAFSAYIDATALSKHPETLNMNVTAGTATIIDNTLVSDADVIVTVYNLQGMPVRRNVVVSDATTGLPAGIYIVGGKKVMVK